MKAQKIAAGFLIGLGLVLATLFAAPLPAKWLPFSVSVAGLTVGLVWLRFLSRREISANANGRNRTKDLPTLLEEAYEKITAVLQKMRVREKWSTAEITADLEEIGVTHFAPISENRDSLLERYGVKRYANLMIAVATAERYFNRGVSAAMDGYREESVRSLNDCLPPLKEAIEKAKGSR